MAEDIAPTQVMGDYARPVVESSPSCITLPTAARNYELKTLHFNMLPSFHGMASEDPLNFIRDFYSIIQSFPLSNLTEDQLKMRCFPYTLKDAAKTWFMTLTPGSLTTWEMVYNKFISKFYSHQKTKALRSEICTFNQDMGEPFHEAWDRFKMFLVKCPHHGFTQQLLNQFFYDGLNQICQAMVDNAAGGAILEKNPDETKALYEKLGQNSQQKSVRAGKSEAREVETNGEIKKQLNWLTAQMQNLLNTRGVGQSANMVNSACDICDVLTHSTDNCPNREQFPEFMNANANSINNFTPAERVKLFEPTSYPGTKFHPNLSWGGNQRNQGQYQQRLQQPRNEHQSSAYSGSLADIVHRNEQRLLENEKRIMETEQKMGNIEGSMRKSGGSNGTTGRSSAEEFTRHSSKSTRASKSSLFKEW